MTGTAEVEVVPAVTPRHPNLAAALAAFQAELPTIKKGNTAKVETKNGGSGYSYDYADLADISPVVLPLLGQHGLSWTTSPTLVPDLGFVLTYELLHESGDTREGIYPLPASNTPAQQLGSAITYARRYCLCAVTGVAPGGDDDDAQAAQQVATPAPRGKAAPRQKPIAPAQPTRDWIGEANKITDLDALTALAEEADRAGELGLKAGEGRVIDGLKARRVQLERGDEDPAKGNGYVSNTPTAADPEPAGRDWVREARAMTTWPKVRDLLTEAKAGGASQEDLDQIMQHGNGLPDDPDALPVALAEPIPFPEPTVDWEPPKGGDAA